MAATKKRTANKPRGYAAHPVGMGHHVMRNKEQVRVVKRGLSAKGMERDARCLHAGAKGQVCYRVYRHTGEHRYRR